MAIQTFYNPTYTGSASGSVTVADSTHIVVQLPTVGVVDTYYGSFSYAGDGSLAAGTVTSIEESYRGLLSFSITNLAVPAGPLANAVLTNNASAILNLIWGGSDQITGSIYGEPIVGMGGNDTIIAGDGDDTVAGGDGNDDVNGNVGNDLVFGGPGVDIVRGGKGDDTVYGDDGDDIQVNGNIGNDLVHGGAGNDFVYGGQDNDTLYGDAGNDVLSGDLGQDILYGGAGADRFVIAKGGGFDWVGDFNFAEGDRIQLAPGASYTVTSYAGQVVIDLGGGAELGLSGVAAGSFSTDWIVYA